MVLARTGGDPGPIRFADIGLASDRDYVAFEFWTKSLIGTFQRAFTPGAVDPRFDVQAICLRQKTSHPQLVATNRHVSCGATDVTSVRWAANALDGVSDVVANDPYEIYLTEPDGFAFADLRVTGAEALSNQKVGALRVLRLRSEQNRAVQWRIEYRSQLKSGINWERIPN